MIAASRIDDLQGGVDIVDQGVRGTAVGHQRGTRRQTQAGQRGIGGRDGDGVVGGGVGADLEVDAGRTAQQEGFVELGALGDTVDFFEAGIDFRIDRIAVGSAVRIVGGLHGQFTNALQVVIDFVQVAFGGLGQRDAVVGVAGGLRHAADLGGHAVGDGLAGGVVLGAVDAQARGQALDRGAQGGLRLVQVVLGDQSEVVGVDNRSARISSN